MLQTKVFPHIKQYCKQLGYTFQPIDLRWGVSNEAQIDQKTLELCLSEVRSCKSYSHPNFLLMIGDRYGWVPLPYVIEKNEFESLLTHLNAAQKDILNLWYQQDLNQLPTSYILKERINEFVSAQVWNTVEAELRSIFQQAAKKANLKEAQLKKYFLSATEAEVTEGLFPYLELTDHQKILLQKSPDLLNVDAKNVFGFFREVIVESKKSNKYIRHDYPLAQQFKQKVKSVLLEENILNVETKQADVHSLEEQYLSDFIDRTISFLETKVNDQHSLALTRNYTALELEIEAQ